MERSTRSVVGISGLQAGEDVKEKAGSVWYFLEGENA